MEIQLLTVGTRMPSWVSEGYREYARRMPRKCVLKLAEIPPGRRSRSQPVAKAMAEEGRRMLAAIPGDNQVIALDVTGRSWSTPKLAEQMRGWMQDGRNLSLLVGGPDGLFPDCLQRAGQRWSLSELTLPHPLVRVLVAEQLYRAWTIINGHPYHRA